MKSAGQPHDGSQSRPGASPGHLLYGFGKAWFRRYGDLPLGGLCMPAWRWRLSGTQDLLRAAQSRWRRFGLPHRGGGARRPARVAGISIRQGVGAHAIELGIQDENVIDGRRGRDRGIACWFTPALPRQPRRRLRPSRPRRRRRSWPARSTAARNTIGHFNGGGANACWRCVERQPLGRGPAAVELNLQVSRGAAGLDIGSADNTEGYVSASPRHHSAAVSPGRAGHPDQRL